jgi:hypothetical protein
MSLSSFVDTIIVNNITNNANNINILDTININVKNDINYGIETKVIKNNLNRKIYHIYKNNIISENNIAPIKHIIDNYIYFFRNNYLYYLDKTTNRIKLKKLIFKNCLNGLNENNFEIHSEEYAENIYYFNISISCEECNYIYVNETNNYILLLLPEMETIIVYDITNLSENYILLPSNKNYSECMVMNDKDNISSIAYLYCKNDITNDIDVYSINPNTYSIEFIKNMHFVHKVLKNVITSYNIFSLCEDNTLIINLNMNNTITNVNDILLNNYFIKDNALQIISPYKITSLKIQDYNIMYMKDLITCSNIDKPVFIITNE